MDLPDLNGLTVDELNQLSDQLDLEGLVIQENKHRVAKARRSLVEIEHAAYYGFTPEEYREVKRRAAEQGVPLNWVMAKARKARAVQVARAGMAEFGVHTAPPAGNG